MEKLTIVIDGSRITVTNGEEPYLMCEFEGFSERDLFDWALGNTMNELKLFRSQAKMILEFLKKP